MTVLSAARRTTPSGDALLEHIRIIAVYHKQGRPSTDLKAVLSSLKEETRAPVANMGAVYYLSLIHI